MPDYKQIRDQLQTGDIILFGATYGESKLIEDLTGAPYSHSGMILRLPNIDDKVYFWEAVTETRAFRDPEADNLKHMGARVVKFEKLLPYYTPYTNNQFTWRQLTYNRSPQFQQAVETFVKTTDGTPFTPLIQMLINYFLGHYKNIPVANIPYNMLTGPSGVINGFQWSIGFLQNAMYCAQLVASTYQAVGLLAATPPANYYAPADLAQAANMQLLNGASLGPDTVVTYSGAQNTATAAAQT